MYFLCDGWMSMCLTQGIKHVCLCRPLVRSNVKPHRFTAAASSMLLIIIARKKYESWHKISRTSRLGQKAHLGPVLVQWCSYPIWAGPCCADARRSSSSWSSGLSSFLLPTRPGHTRPDFAWVQNVHVTSRPHESMISPSIFKSLGRWFTRF